MSTIRPLATIAILAALGIFLAKQINKQPIASTASLSGGWDEAPAYGAGDAAAGSESDSAATDPAAAATTPGVGPGGDSDFGLQSPSLTPPSAPQQTSPVDENAAPGLPALPPLPSLPSSDPLTAGTTPTIPPSGPSAVDPAAIDALNLPLPEDIPEANYSGDPSGAGSTTSANSGSSNIGQVTGRVPSLGTSTSGNSAPGYTSQANTTASLPPAPPAAGTSSATPAQTMPTQPPAAPAYPSEGDRYGASSYGAPAVDSAANPYQQTANSENADPAGATTPIDFGQTSQNTQPSAAPQTSLSSNDGGVSFAAAQPAIQAALDRGELARAHMLLSQWYGDPSLSTEDRRDVDQLLGQLAGTVVYSTEHLLEPPHQVQPGETLETIAENYNVPWQLLAKINGISRSDAAQPGQILKVVRGPFNAVVDLGDSEVALMVKGRYAGRFPVDLASLPASEGTFKVDQKLAEPVRSTAYAPTTQSATATVMQRKLVIKDPGSAASPAIEIAAVSSTASPKYGAQPARISVAARDLDELYDILSVGSEVTVRR